MKNFLFISIFIFFFTSDKIYNRVKLDDITIELSHDDGNKCINNIKIINNTNKVINYQIQIWRGEFWYFRHKLELKANETRYYNDAFITCDNKSEIMIELKKINP